MIVALLGRCRAMTGIAAVSSPTLRHRSLERTRTGDDGAPVAKVPGLSEGLPTHQGPHRNYSKAVTRAADKVMRELLAEGGTLSELSDEALLAAAVKVRDLAWKILLSWEGPHLK